MFQCYQNLAKTLVDAMHEEGNVTTKTRGVYVRQRCSPFLEDKKRLDPVEGGI
jgi:hypothetical protein